MNDTEVHYLKRKIKKVKVVSFDLYNTLLFRKTRLPEDVFTVMELVSGMSGFRKKREAMQVRACRKIRRKYGYPHPSLHEIYQLGGWKKTISGRMEQLERRTEEETAVANYVMCGLLGFAKKCGKRVIITTDMYLERSTVERILKACSITGWDEIYLSSERKKTKYDGTMFDYILQKEGICAEEFLHIGDDEKSDILMAKRRGIWVYHYKDWRPDLAYSLYKKSHTDGESFLHGKRGTFWYLLGYQIGGPLYMGLGTWLKEVLGNRKLFCLSRDGFVLTKELSEFGISDCEYIYSSRRALMLPYIKKLGAEELSILPPYSCGQTIREVLHYMGFEQIPEKEFQQAGFIGFDAVIHDKNDIKKIKQIYKKYEKLVLGVCEKERRALLKYFESKDMFQQQMCFFDSGWRGTSQYLIEKIYLALHEDYKDKNKETKIHFYYAGIKKNRIIGKRLKSSSYSSYLAEFLDKKTLNRMLSASAVAELFFSADEPALVCYGEDGLHFEARRERPHIRYINQGIEDYIHQNKYLISKLSEESLERLGVSALKRILLKPGAAEAEIIGDLENEDSLSATGQMKKYIAKISGEALRKNLFLDIYWEQGIYRNPRNTAGVKMFVWIRQRAASVAGLFQNR